MSDPKPKAYRATEAVYVDGVIYKAGETFVTDKPKGKAWEDLNPVEKAAAEAGKDIKDDVDYSKLSASELKAVAAAKGINLGAATSKEDIIAVIKAENDPTR